MERNFNAVDAMAGSFGAAPPKRKREKRSDDLNINRVKKKMVEPEKAKHDESKTKKEIDGDLRQKVMAKDELLPSSPSPSTKTADQSLFPPVFSNVNIYLSSESKAVDTNKYKEEIAKLCEEGSVHFRGAFRAKKKLLVLDIDRTIWDNHSRVARPHLHSMLEKAYTDFNICLWSETSMKWVHKKLKWMNLHKNQNFGINFLLSQDSMMFVAEADGSVIRVKDLEVVWKKFPFYSAKNTVIVDDISDKFLLNPQSGIKIKRFEDTGEDVDDELVYLSLYLQILGNSNDLRTFDHTNWREVVTSGVS